MFSKHRLEALSDAVFAIAMTLLILDIKAPTELGTEPLGAALRHGGHEWISFVVTFGIASLFWVLQHKVFEVLENVGSGSTVLTFVFLGFVTTLPFSTALWGHHISQPLASMFYFGNQFLIALTLAIKLEMARRKGHVHLGRDLSHLRLRLWVLCGVMGSACVAAVLLPIQYVSLGPLLLAFAGKRLRERQKQRWALLEPVSAPSVPSVEQ